MVILVEGLIGVAGLVLIVCSVLSVAIMIERSMTLKRYHQSLESLYPRLAELLRNKRTRDLKELCGRKDSPLCAVVLAVLNHEEHPLTFSPEVLSKALVIEQVKISERLSFLATIGSTAPFVGLFGTVLGIIKAFHDIAAKGFGGPTVVARGISEALITTALGLFVAIPAVVAYNHFVGRVNQLMLRVDALAFDLSAVVPEGGL